jgi:hypothetical protein
MYVCTAFHRETVLQYAFLLGRDAIDAHTQFYAKAFPVFLSGNSAWAPLIVTPHLYFNQMRRKFLMYHDNCLLTGRPMPVLILLILIVPRQCYSSAVLVLIHKFF